MGLAAINFSFDSLIQLLSAASEPLSTISILVAAVITVWSKAAAVLDSKNAMSAIALSEEIKHLT